jgi:hypothetical protein
MSVAGFYWDEIDEGAAPEQSRVDVRLSWSLSSRVELALAAEDVFDDDEPETFTTSGYPVSSFGRNLSAKLRLTFR